MLASTLLPLVVAPDRRRTLPPLGVNTVAAPPPETGGVVGWPAPSPGTGLGLGLGEGAGEAEKLRKRVMA